MRTQQQQQQLSSPVFEIKIAVLGHVSAGKSTVINALLRGMYSEVSGSMRRTTAGINYFRLAHPPPSPPSQQQQQQGHSPSNNAGFGHNDQEGCHHRTADSTLQEIIKDNAAFRGSSSNEIHVKYFDIMVKDPLCEMAEDAKLVLVEIPAGTGTTSSSTNINEATTSSTDEGNNNNCVYQQYVSDNWETFECAIVVMDALQGGSGSSCMEENVQLLELVKENNATKKDIPVIILCNKVDHPELQEQIVLVRQIREQVERVFPITSQGSSLSLSSPQQQGGPRFPAFISTSAVLAFITRAAVVQSFDQFCTNFDLELIDKIGTREIGMLQWRKMTRENKFRLVYDMVHDESLYQEQMTTTNFDKFLTILNSAVGGADTQRQIMEQQTNPILFWKKYDESETSALDLLSQSPIHVDALALPFQKLVDYYNFVVSLHESKGQQELTLNRIQQLVRRQIKIILEKESHLTTHDWVTRLSSSEETVEWSSLHPIDWMNICHSILLVARRDPSLYDSFGSELMVFEALASKWIAALNTVQSFGKCPDCLETLDFNYFCPEEKWKPAIEVIFGKGLCTRGRCCSVCRNTGLYDITVDGKFKACTFCGSSPSSDGRDCFQRSNVQKSSLHFSCPNCSNLLSLNRICTSCNIVYVLKDSPYANHCAFCRGKRDEDGFCTKPVSGGNGCPSWRQRQYGYDKCLRPPWKVLPYTFLELFSCTYNDKNGSFEPNYPASYHSVVHLEEANNKSISNPKNYGHVSWLYCRFMASLNKDNKTKSQQG